MHQSELYQDEATYGRHSILQSLLLQCNQELKYKCHVCGYRAKRKCTIQTHIAIKHKLC